MNEWVYGYNAIKMMTVMNLNLKTNSIQMIRSNIRSHHLKTSLIKAAISVNKIGEIGKSFLRNMISSISGN